MPSLPPGAESRALGGAAVLWYTQGDLERARAGLDRVLTLGHAGDIDTVVAQDLPARVEHALGNLTAARERFTRAVEGFRSLGIPWGTGNALSGMASVALATGDTGEAEHLLDQAMPVLRQAGPWFLTWALYVRAIVAVRRGNADEAIALVRESLTWIRDLRTSTRSHTRWFLLLPPRYSKATMRGRRGSWARGTPSASARVPGWSTNRCTTSRSSRNGRFVLASARIGGPSRTPQAAGLSSMRC